MGKSSTIRFAVGTADRPYSGVWRFVVNKNDVYLGASKETMGIFKISLHASVWVLAATEQSGATFENGNRRAKQWSRPLEHAAGITRGPSILVPCTSLGHRPYTVNEHKQVHWFPSPNVGEVIEFSVYFIEQDATMVCTDDHTIVTETSLEKGGTVALLQRALPASQQYLSKCEKRLRENVFRVDDVRNIFNHSFLLFSESEDDPRVPIVTDLPINLRPKMELADAIRAAMRDK